MPRLRLFALAVVVAIALFLSTAPLRETPPQVETVVVDAAALRLGENVTVALDCSSCKVVILVNRTLFEEGRLYIIYVETDGCFRVYSPTQRLTADVCYYAKLQHSIDNAPRWPTNYTLYLWPRELEWLGRRLPSATSYTITVKATTYQDPDYGPFCRPC